MSFATTTEVAIFERIVLPALHGPSEEAARSILAMQFSPDDQQRMQLLADKAKQGHLSPDEEQEIESYERVGHYLAILRSKARVALKAAPGGIS